MKNCENTSMLCKIFQLNYSGATNLKEYANKIYEKCFLKNFCKSSKKQDFSINSIENVITNQNRTILPTLDDVWIFGYGSLVWKADFPYIDRKRGYICGYQRRFYQNSIDHRGTHEKPGRVVTLLNTDKINDRVYGVAYRIASEQKNDVLHHLDYREKNGYERCTVEFHEFPETKMNNFSIIMYIATKFNESYAGHISEIPCIAEQIFTSAGPSGPNRDYLFNLANAMRELFPGVVDGHLFDLEQEVLNRIHRDELQLLEKIVVTEIEMILKSSNEFRDILMKIESFQQYCLMSGSKEALLAKALQTEKNI